MLLPCPLQDLDHRGELRRIADGGTSDLLDRIGRNVHIAKARGQLEFLHQSGDRIGGSQGRIEVRGVIGNQTEGLCHRREPARLRRGLGPHDVREGDAGGDPVGHAIGRPDPPPQVVA